MFLKPVVLAQLIETFCAMTRFLGWNLKVFKEFVKYYKGSASFQNKDVHVLKQASFSMFLWKNAHTFHYSLAQYLEENLKSFHFYS